MILGLTAALGMAAVVFAPDTAEAQASGQIILTQNKIPTNVGKKKLRKFLRKNRKKKISKRPGSNVYQVYVAAKLRRKPSGADVKRNGGQLHIAFYKRTKRGWKYANVMHITYSQGRVLIFPMQISGDLGLEKNKLYQMRLTIFDRRKKERILAKTTFKLK